MDKTVGYAIDRAVFYTTEYDLTADVLFKDGEQAIVSVSHAGTQKKLKEGWRVVATYKGGAPV